METAKRPKFLIVFGILGVFTFIETLVSYIQPSAVRLPTLIILALIKVLLVLLYFMHLKFDSRLFSYFFIAGCILSIPIILILTITTPSIYW
jgi:cytochrome c oxidase subunit 4